ncbi:MAG: cell division protein FtsZ, partial [Amylibacter sp.]
PLLDEISLKGAHGVLINITGGHDLTLFEMDEAANRIREEVDEDANIIVGSTLDTGLEGLMRVSVVATGIDAAANVGDIPVPRRSMKEPLPQAVVLEEPVQKTAEVAKEAEPATEDQEVADLPVGNLEMFDTEPQFNDAAFEQAPVDDLPPPAYQPAAQAEKPVEDFFQMEEERPTFVAPQSRPTGQPSAETMARLHAAASKATTSPAPGAADERVGKPRGFGLNSLISKMTGHSDNHGASNRAYAQQPNLVAVEDDQVYEEPEMSEDQERIEIPAFLRRQAN